HADVHVAGTGRRVACGLSVRPVQPGQRVVRDVYRLAALPRAQSLGGAQAGLRRDAATNPGGQSGGAARAGGTGGATARQDPGRPLRLRAGGGRPAGAAPGGTATRRHAFGTSAGALRGIAGEETGPGATAPVAPALADGCRGWAGAAWRVGPERGDG